MRCLRVSILLEKKERMWLRVTLQDCTAVFHVEDDGCGIPSERMERLFSGLLDSEAPADNRRSNMGIGLSVCNTIIKAHGSRILAENRPTGGASFQFALKMEENDHVEQ